MIPRRRVVLSLVALYALLAGIVLVDGLTSGWPDLIRIVPIFVLATIGAALAIIRLRGRIE